MSLLLLLSLSACGTKQLQESKTETVTEVVAEQAIVSTVSDTSQDAVQSAGANVKGAVDTVVTENVTGISTYWFIIGALIFGMIIPQPRFIRWLF